MSYFLSNRQANKQAEPYPACLLVTNSVSPGDTYEMKRCDRDKECDLDILGDFYEDTRERLAETDMNYILVYFLKITTGDVFVGLILYQASDSTFTRLGVYLFYGPTSRTQAECVYYLDYPSEKNDWDKEQNRQAQGQFDWPDGCEPKIITLV